MNTQLLFSYLRNFIVLSESDLEKAKSYIREIRFSKDDLIITKGNIPRFAYFINRGTAMYYTFSKYDQVEPLQFQTTGSLLIPWEFFEHKPSRVFICALEDIELIGFSYHDFEKILNAYPNMPKLFMEIQRVSYHLKEERSRILEITDNWERVKYFESRYPILRSLIHNSLRAAFLKMGKSTYLRLKSQYFRTV